MKTKSLLKFCLTVAWVLLVMVPVAEGAEAKVKVHKDKVTVVGPDGEGMVVVKGEAGAIESTSGVSLKVENLSTKEKVDGEMGIDGDFEVRIAAAAGEKVRVWARNEEGKRSYGTFTVPENKEEKTQDKEKSVDEQKPSKPQRGQGRRGAKQDESKNLAVVVMVVDTGTGEVLATERIAGVPRQNMRDEEQYALAAQRIASKSITAAKGELRPGVVRENQLSPREKAHLQKGSERAARAEKIKAEIKAVVDKELQPLIDGKKNVGAVVGIVRGGESYVFGYGKKALYDEETPDGDTIYEIGSITKVFTAAVLVKMAQEGLVEPGDAVGKYLPESVRMPKYEERQIRLGELATHTSGLPRMPSNIVPMDPANPYVNYQAQQLYEFLGGYELKREPGSKYEYSNLGAGLLGHVLARKAGKGYEELVVEEICGPLGMKDTRITLAEQKRGRLAAAYSSMGVGMLRMYMPSSNWDFKVLAGCGALRSTVNDMVKFIRANLGQEDAWGETPPSKTVNDLQKVLAETHKEKHKVDDFLGMGWGWHIFRSENKGEGIIWHNGGTGGYRSFLGFVKQEQIGIVVLSNTDSSVDEAAIAILKMLKKSERVKK